MRRIECFAAIAVRNAAIFSSVGSRVARAQA